MKSPIVTLEEGLRFCEEWLKDPNCSGGQVEIKKFQIEEHKKAIEILKEYEEDQLAPLCNVVNKVIPYQVCPKCNGDGEVFTNHWNGGTTVNSAGMETCDVCGGNKIIPMYVIDNNQ